MSMKRTNPVSAPPLDGVASPTGRIASLDQFRGYTVAGMLLVNFLGGFAAVPAVLKHHNTYCSYADTIMPQFFFAVGFAYRLTFLKRLRDVGTRRRDRRRRPAQPRADRPRVRPLPPRRRREDLGRPDGPRAGRVRDDGLPADRCSRPSCTSRWRRSGSCR